MKILEFLSFEGRARRNEFWKFVLIVQLPAQIVVGCVMAYLVAKHGTCRLICSEMSRADICCFFGGIITLGVVSVLSLGVTVRRLHDLNLSGWWLVVIITLNSITILRIPALVIGVVVLGCMPGSDGRNRFGD